MLAILLIENVSALLMMLKDCCRSAFRCCVVCISRLPLPLWDRVPVVVVVVVVVVAMVFQLSLEGRRHGDKDVDGGRVDVVDAAKGLLSETNKQTRIRL